MALCREICTVNLLFLLGDLLDVKGNCTASHFYLELISPAADRIMSSKGMFTDVLLHAQAKIVRNIFNSDENPFIFFRY
jgi:hypothetical protein